MTYWSQFSHYEIMSMQGVEHDDDMDDDSGSSSNAGDDDDSGFDRLECPKCRGRGCDYCL